MTIKDRTVLIFLKDDNLSSLIVPRSLAFIDENTKGK